MYILSAILWLPLLGAVTVASLPVERTRLVPWTAGAVSGMVVLMTFSLLVRYDADSSGVQLAEALPWSPDLGSTYALGVDGLSLPMVMLSALLCFVAVLASGSVRERTWGYFAWLLMLETGLLGVFLSQDWALFYLFWEMTLIPLFFLIDRWGGKRRHRASLTFVLYTMGGSVFMLISLLVLYQSSNEHVSNLTVLAKVGAQLSPNQQFWVLLGLLVGFGVKLPIFPPCMAGCLWPTWRRPAR